MGKKSSAPPPPDYGPLIAASKEASQLSYKLGQDQLKWAKEQYAKDSAITGKVIDQFLGDMAENSANAKADRARYESVFQPLEDDLAREAQDYATPERRDLEMGRAQSGVAQQFAAARESAKAELESFGINPSATRYAALDVGMRANEAAAKAAAGNQAGVMVDDRARQLRSEAIAVGQRYPGQVAQQYGVAQGAGAGAGGQTLATTGSGANTMGTAPQYMGLGNNALGTWGSTINTGYQNQLDAWKANQSQSSGIGGLIGGALGLAMGFDEGGAVPPGEGVPVSAQPTQGGAVPVHASPTGGRAIDDVAARLTPGEFVVPKDVVSWKGEEFFQKLMKQSREARTMPDNARPTVRQALPAGRPQYRSQAIAA